MKMEFLASKANFEMTQGANDQGTQGCSDDERKIGIEKALSLNPAGPGHSSRLDDLRMIAKILTSRTSLFDEAYMDRGLVYITHVRS